MQRHLQRTWDNPVALLNHSKITKGSIQNDCCHAKSDREPQSHHSIGPSSSTRRNHAVLCSYGNMYHGQLIAKHQHHLSLYGQSRWLRPAHGGVHRMSNRTDSFNGDNHLDDCFVHVQYFLGSIWEVPSVPVIVV